MICFSRRRRHTRCALVTGVRRVLVRSLLVRHQDAPGDLSDQEGREPESWFERTRQDQRRQDRSLEADRNRRDQDEGSQRERSGTGNEDHRGQRALDGPRRDRKSVVKGKSVSVRVDLGGRRLIKKKNKRKQKKEEN